MNPKEINWNFLNWVRNVFLFRDDLRTQLMELNAPEHIMFCFAYSDSLIKEGNIIKFYAECSFHRNPGHQEFIQWFNIWIEDCYQQWLKHHEWENNLKTRTNQ